MGPPILHGLIGHMCGAHMGARYAAHVHLSVPPATGGHIVLDCRWDHPSPLTLWEGLRPSPSQSVLPTSHLSYVVHPGPEWGLQVLYVWRLPVILRLQLGINGELTLTTLPSGGVAGDRGCLHMSSCWVGAPSGPRFTFLPQTVFSGCRVSPNYCICILVELWACVVRRLGYLCL